MTPNLFFVAKAEGCWPRLTTLSAAVSAGFKRTPRAPSQFSTRNHWAQIPFEHGSVPILRNSPRLDFCNLLLKLVFRCVSVIYAYLADIHGANPRPAKMVKTNFIRTFYCNRRVSSTWLEGWGYPLSFTVRMTHLLLSSIEIINFQSETLLEIRLWEIQKKSFM